jgi:phage baseplate assembly protein W
MRPIQDVVYADIDISFARHPVTKQLITLKNERSISQAVKNLVLTNSYERPFKPTLYGGVTEQLFDNFDPISMARMEEQVKTVLRNYEPRAELLNVNVNPDYDRNGFIISIFYRPLNKKEPVKIDVFLERVR